MRKLGISDLIAQFINEALSEENGTAELQRTDLAGKFNCVPSQINYVLSTRFSPERGYIVESRRGGGGYIRITKVRTDPKQLIMHTVNAVGDKLDKNTARAFVSNLLSNNAIDAPAARLLLAATGDRAMRPVPAENRDEARAAIFKQMLINVI